MQRLVLLCVAGGYGAASLVNSLNWPLVANFWRQRCSRCGMAGAEHQAFLRRVDLEGPGSASLQALLRVLQAQGHTLVSPADRLDLHPLAVPLTRVSAPSGPAHAAVTTIATASALFPCRPRVVVLRVGARSRIRTSRTDGYGQYSILQLIQASLPGCSSSPAHHNCAAHMIENANGTGAILWACCA